MTTPSNTLLLFFIFSQNNNTRKKSKEEKAIEQAINNHNVPSIDLSFLDEQSKAQANKEVEKLYQSPYSQS